MAFNKVRGVIYFVITTKIFNHLKLLIIIYYLLEKDSLQNGAYGIYSVSNIIRCLVLLLEIYLTVALFPYTEVHPATVHISVIVTESHPKTESFGKNIFFFIVRYKSVNAQCVAVNSKNFSPVYKVNAIGCMK